MDISPDLKVTQPTVTLISNTFIKIENYCIYCLEKGNTYTCLKIGLV